MEMKFKIKDDEKNLVSLNESCGLIKIKIAGDVVDRTPDKDKSIVAQCLTKVVFGSVDITPESVLETYRYFLEKL